jgi:hypothetical protein
MAELETEHSDQIVSIKSQHQSDIDASSSLANLGDNDDLRKMTLDVQVLDLISIIYSAGSDL